MSRKKYVNGFPNTWFLNAGDLPELLVESVMATSCRPLLVSEDFDMKRFARQGLGSVSLSMVEKNRVIEAWPTLSYFQCSQLVEVWDDEAEQFAALADDAPERRQLAALSAAMVLGAFALAAFRGAGYPDRAAEAAAIREMVEHKLKANGQARKFIPSDFWGNAAVEHVYGAVHAGRRRSARLGTTGPSAGNNLLEI